MILKQIKIDGYRSIDHLEIPVEKRGQAESYTSILLGKNGTGKSNILDAIALPELLNTDGQVDFSSLRNMQKEPSVVSITYVFAPDPGFDYKDCVSSNVDMPDELLENIIVTEITERLVLEKGKDSKIEYEIQFEHPALEHYYCITVAGNGVEQVLTNDTAIKDEKIVVKKLEEGEDAIMDKLSADLFHKVVVYSLQEYIAARKPDINIWKAEPKYLVGEGGINLKEFAQSYDNVPLRNMFSLAGYQDKVEVSEIVAEIEGNLKARKKLTKQLSKKTTTYLNDRWKEHEVRIEVEINGDLIASVFVQDKCDAENYFAMSDRSQGFKQFVSLLLSLSIANTVGDIENRIIIIDEPEVHLHPSGVRWLLKELLEIGKNNYLFIATHSEFMLDKNTQDRHFLLSKGKENLTELRQITTEDYLQDDEILEKAFGINVIADFLTPYRVLVEGACDKTLLNKAFTAHGVNDKIAISNGTGANVVATATLLAFSGIDVLTIVDDDQAGKKIKKEVAKIGDKFEESVYTIRDLVGEITDGGTIEDTLPMGYVEKKINDVLTSEGIETIKLSENEAFMSQLSEHLSKKMLKGRATKDDKDAMGRIKQQIKKSIAEEYDAKSIKQHAPKLYALAGAIMLKMGIVTKDQGQKAETRDPK